MSTQLQLVRDLFVHLISDIPPEEWEQALLKLCPNDAALRKQVRGLLTAHQEQDSLLDRPDPEATSPTAESPDHDELPTSQRIGPYKLLQKIGEGGMGMVYLAEETEPVRRKVALKIIKPGMDTKEVIARFEAERQALALMDHPNIARILGGGVMETGRPYFVMDLVHGTPLNKFCDQTRMTTQQRLELFLDVCRAVQHAHQKGIIHRDLKPTNVLVSMDDVRPVPKVIDFGVAKALSQQLTEKTLFTAYGQMIGTPLYMSPEQTQYSVQDVDTRSDIYSLGVLLYELLTGSTPFDKETLQKSGYEGMRKLICEVDPPRPSHRVATLNLAARTTVADQRHADPRKLQDSLQGELDWIVMKTLEKDRNRRYETVNGLAADIQRYLNNEPVQACPPSTVYRLRKTFQRHRTSFITGGAAVVVMLMAITGLGIANRLLSEAQQQTEKALQEARDSQQAAQASQKRAEEGEARVRQHYNQSLKTVQSIIDTVTTWKLSEQPGMEQYRLELFESANNALAQLQESNPSDEQALEIRVNVLVALASDYESKQRLEESAHCFEFALQILDQLKTLVPKKSQEYRFLEWQVRYQHVFPLQRLDRLDEAERQLQRAMLLIRESIHDSPNDRSFFSALCNMLNTLSILELQRGDQSASDLALVQAAEVLGLPVDGQLQFITSMTASYTEALLEKGFRNDAIANLLSSIAHRQKNSLHRKLCLDQAFQCRRAEVNDNNTRVGRHNLAYSLLSSGIELRHAGDYESAAQYLRESSEILEKLVEEFPTLDRYRSDLQKCQIAHGRSLLSLNRSDEAALLIERMKSADDRVPELHELLGSFYSDAKDYARAAQEYDRMIEAAGEEVTAHHYRLRGHFFAEKLGDHERALADFDRAIELDTTDSYWLGVRANSLTSLGRLEEASAAYKDLLAKNPQAGWWLWKRSGAVAFQLGDFSQALTALRKAVELNPGDGSNLYWIDPQLVAQCPDDEFREGLRKLADYAVVASDTADTRFGRGRLLFGLGEVDRAIADFEKAKQLNPASHMAHYYVGLLHLSQGATDDWKAVCKQSLAKFADAEDAVAQHFTSWTCALGPQALEDYEPAIQLARKSLEAVPERQQYLQGLGAILMRAGRFEEARDVLQQALQTPADTNTSAAYIGYFLAMSEFHLGNLAGAQEHLQAANQDAASHLNNPTAPWNRKLTLKLLKQQAESLLNFNPPIETDSLRPSAQELPVQPSP